MSSMIWGVLAPTWAPETLGIDLGLYSFIFQPRIQPNFEPQFWLIVRVMTSYQNHQ